MNVTSSYKIFPISRNACYEFVSIYDVQTYIINDNSAMKVLNSSASVDSYVYIRFWLGCP